MPHEPWIPACAGMTPFGFLSAKNVAASPPARGQAAGGLNREPQGRRSRARTVNLLLVALGGAAGALARYGLGLAAVRLWGGGAPWGTWAANALGSLLIGLALPLVAGDRARLALVVGVLGSFTTFSTYSADTVVLWEAGRHGLAVANAVGSLAVGVVCVGAGLWAGRHLAG